jgi:DNA-binding NarL/FixJ family response regulator
MRRLLASRFRYMRIAEASTHGEALRMASAIAADLVFADVRLPGGSGLALARLLAQALPQARVCIVSSLDLPEYRLAAKAAGAAHFLAKADSTSDQIAAVIEVTLAPRPRTLVIDSDAARRTMTSSCLRSHCPSMMVFAAASGATGLATASAVGPDIVLLPASLLLRAGPGIGAAIKALAAAPRIVAFGRAARDPGPSLRAGADHAVESPALIDSAVAAMIEGAMARRAHAASPRTPVTA